MPDLCVACRLHRWELPKGDAQSVRLNCDYHSYVEVNNVVTLVGFKL